MTPLTSQPIIDGNGIILPVEEAAMAHLPHRVTLEGRTYERKREFHATLLGKTLIERLGLDHSQVRDLAQEAQAHQWTIELGNAYVRLVRQRRDDDERTDRRQSIVQMADIANASGFFDRVSVIADQAVEVPPAHVTLYTFGNPRGIGVYTRQELGELLPKDLALEDLLWRED